MVPKRNHVFTVFFLLCAVLFLFACTETKPPAESTTIKKVTLKGEETILAEVNDTPVSRHDLALEIATTLSQVPQSAINDDTRQKVLDAIITRRAIAQLRQKELTPEQERMLEKQVQIHRENLLVKQYLAQHAGDTKITEEEIRKYYDDHPVQFGARTIKRYEMIAGSAELNMSQRDNLITLTQNADKEKDWAAYTARLQKNGFPVSYRTGNTDARMLQKRLKDLMKSLKPQEASPLTFVEGRPFLVRILEDKTLPPKPFAEVRADIRKILRPRLYKEAVKKVRDDVMGKTRVVYKNKEEKG